MYSRLDRWLKKMSLLGWHIVHSGLFSFLFEKGEPAEKEYFTYYITAPCNGKYSVADRHPFLEKIYGVKKKKSKINSNESKVYLTVEIDLKRIDVQNNIGYKELIDDRNRLFKKLFIRDSLGLLFFVILFVVLLLIF